MIVMMKGTKRRNYDYYYNMLTPPVKCYSVI